MAQVELDPFHDRHLVRRDHWGKPNGIERLSEVRRSYDCSLPTNRHLCMHSARAAHGFRFEEWWYGVRRDHYALSTGICCPRDSPDVPPGYRHYVGGPPMPIFTTVFTVLFDTQGKPVNTTNIYKSGSGDLSDYADPTYEQPEFFWRAVEAKLDEIASPHQSARAN